MQARQFPAAISMAFLLGCGIARADIPPSSPPPAEGDYVIRDFHFASGESLPELRMHYLAIGKPKRDAHGRVVNAVLLLHGTGGSGRSLLNDRFAGVLFGKGQLLDGNRYYLILPDGIGHGNSSKPSDGLHARFPQYDYQDMVAAQHALLVDGLKVDHLRLVLGTSMGCMHTFMWGETFPDFVDALMPLACLPVQIAGRNRLWRNLLMQAIRQDPDWQSGEYKTEPLRALRTAAGLLLMAGSAPIQMQMTLPTRDTADEFLKTYMDRQLNELDANDLLYAVNASRDYDPSAGLEKIRAPLVHINSADDFINPPELGIAEREIKRVPNGRFILIPASDQTHGHGTHTWAAVWQQYLAQLLAASQPAAATPPP
ncbi:MAG TPA: alpha/beta fold hydrolase [Steroidobacteraceae bacterium]|jgi:homoserine O-acetyltransferase|nr:alpha/beta fold hydrolase [Steroidobacteraceae bacterium]